MTFGGGSMEHVLTHRLTGRTEENAEVGVYRVQCSCGWSVEDVRGFRAMADLEDRHRQENEPSA